MKITEKELEDMIEANLHSDQGINKLADKGLWFITHIYEYSEMRGKSVGVERSIYRQFEVKPYGIPDLVIVDIIEEEKFVNVTIIELKVEGVKLKHFDQVLRYKTAYSELVKRDMPDYTCNIDCVLIGHKSVDSGHYVHNYSDVIVYTFNYSLDGINFEYQESGWVIEGGIDDGVQKIHPNCEEIAQQGVK